MPLHVASRLRDHTLGSQYVAQYVYKALYFHGKGWIRSGLSRRRGEAQVDLSLKKYPLFFRKVLVEAFMVDIQAICP